jgi:hypothetical protein
MRLLLLKQDQLSLLEENLNDLDASEERELFLGCSRLDCNTARKTVIEELTNTMVDYGNTAKRNTELQ